MADDPRLSCGRSIDDVWSHIEGPPDAHERDCPYCLEARARLLRLSAATADLRVAESEDPDLQLAPDFTASVMTLVRAEVRRGQAIPLQPEAATALTISEQAVVGLVWLAADAVPGLRARRCQVRTVEQEAATDKTLVDVELSVVVGPGVSVPAVTAELRTQVRALVDAEAGLQVRRVDLVVEDVL